MTDPMRNSAFEAQGGRMPSAGDLLQNPIFSNVVRLLMIVIIGLGGYLWKTEMDHVNKALAAIQAGVDTNIERQWGEIHAVRREVSQLNQDLYRVLYRTNELLYELVREPQAPARGADTKRPVRR